MKILHVITSLYMGGAEKLVVDLVPRFQALGHEVDVALLNSEFTPLMERLEKECPNCKIYKLGHSFYNPLYIVKLIGIMRKYDIVHTHNSSAQLYAAIANIICQKMLVTTEHNTNNRKRGNVLLSSIDKWMYTRYHKIICISHQAEEKLREYLRTDLSNKTQIETIYNGIDINSIHNAAPIDNIKSNRFVIVMVAAFRPQKDQSTLVKAMAKLSGDQYEAWLVGNGECYEKVRNLINELNVGKYVKLLGLRTDVPNLLKTADAIVMSSHYEGLSLSNIEGMAAGKPFIASDVDGIHEITEGYGILVPHQDDNALAEAIQRLHDDKIYCSQVAEKCYKRAMQFDISEMVKRYNETYLNLSGNAV